MSGISLKMFFRNRLTPFMAVLLAAATALLSVGCCLFYSAEEAAQAVTRLFHTIPLLTRYMEEPKWEQGEDGTDEAIQMGNVTYEIYSQTMHTLATSPYLSKDDRRLYTGYAPGIQPLRSRPTLKKDSAGYYYDMSGDGGDRDWEKQYREMVLEATLQEKIQLSSGGDPYSSEYVGPKKMTWLGDPNKRPQMILEPEYMYIFSIDRAHAQTNVRSPLEKLGEQKVYVFFHGEDEYPVELKEGDRCLLYGVGMEQPGISYDAFGTEHEMLYDGRVITSAEYDSMSEEEKEKANDEDHQMLRMSLWIQYPVSPEKSPYALLQGKEALDTGSKEAFVRTSGLGKEAGERWYYIIQNCREGANALSVVTTENSRNILTFNTKATPIIAGRHILPGDTEPVCLISGELAEEYGLSVGDTLPLRLHRAKIDFSMSWVSYKASMQENWSFLTDCESRQEPQKISYRIIGIYRSMGWIPSFYANYFSPNTVFVSAVSTPVIEDSRPKEYDATLLAYYTQEELEIRELPQILWGYYLTESDQAQAFMDSLPEEVRRNVQLLDEGYEHIQPQLEALREQMQGIVLLTLGAWVLVAALFIFLCLFRGQSAMGTLRSLGAGIGYTFRQWLLLCLCLWLVSAGIGGVFSGVLYDKIEQKVFEAASYGDAYNQAFSDLGSAAEQGYNPYEGIQGHSGESAETVYRQVKDTLHIGRVLPLTILAQGGVFLLLCAVTLACLTRRKVPKLLRSV